MVWNLNDAIQYYKKQGAPGDQNALIHLLREIQDENGGSIPMFAVAEVSNAYGIKDTFLKAIIKRIPSLRMTDIHCLELCAGPNCGKHLALAALAEKLQKESAGKFTVKFVPCMRMCGKGPNIRWDRTMYNEANETLLRKLIENN